jgi:uncharacterized membrane protein YeaQ/YmgE (transglycosylase-associated protein family)
MGLLAWLFVGLVAGAVAQWITRTESRGCLATVAIGVLGAFLGGGLYRLLRGDEVEVFDEVDLFALLVATLGAIGLLLVLDAISGRDRRRRRGRSRLR